MPPRYAYWTILVGDQPTAFRAGSQEDLMPTFKRLQAKHADAKMLWFQNGKLWPSRIDAQEAMRARGEMGRRGDERQASFGSRDRDFTRRTQVSRPRTNERPEWKPRGKAEDAAWPKPPAASAASSEKLDWKPKGEFVPAPKRSERPDWTPKSQAPGPKPRGDWKPKTAFDRDRKPAWKPKSQDSRPRTQDSRPRTPRSEKPEWKPKGATADGDRKPRSFARPERKLSGDDTRPAKPEWKPKGSFTRERRPDWKSKTQDARPRTTRPEKLAWSPKSQDSSTASPQKRKWVPKAEYKKSLGIEAKRDDKWRPGGEHRDPKQKYKDAKKAKWSKFKTNIRQKWEKKAGKKSDK